MKIMPPINTILKTKKNLSAVQSELISLNIASTEGKKDILKTQKLTTEVGA